ncbi:DUF6531 domain-containing protein [Enterococcus faecalis]|uniref:DUF6531 domain-containing protein n=2 Tax=Enterococcus faecalis TaxID=1351 RepID=UPI0021575152|nr:DUF6531 domain-containing protein [Enterococcus faecalis]
MKKRIEKIIKYVVLVHLLMGSMPFAYAEEIQDTVEQNKAKNYYKETVENVQESVVPETQNQTEDTSFKETETSPSELDGKKKIDDGNKEYALHLPEVEEKKLNKEEESLKTKYGEPILENGQEQIYKVDDTHFITYINSDVKTYKNEEEIEVPVDLSLVSVNEEDKTIFKPSSSPVAVVLPDKMDQNQGVQVSKGEDTLELMPKDKVYKNVTVKENALLYNNVDEGDDVQYTVTDKGVKEEIILEKWREKHQFVYQFSTEKYSAFLESNQVLIRKKGQKEVLFVLSAPQMMDQAGETSEDITLSLQKQEDHYELTVDASQEWLADEARVYPVRIDPTVTVPTENLIDTVTSSVHGTYQGRGYGYVGYITQEMTGIGNAKDVGRTRIYSKINYDFSKIPKEAKIDSATYNLYQYIQYPQTNATFSSYKLTEDFNIDTLTWDNSVGLSQEPTGEKAISSAKYGLHQFDIRDAVNSWVQGTSKNYGIVVQATNENDYGGAFYTTYSTGGPVQFDFTPDKRPSLTINWSIPDPVDIHYPIKDTTVALRSMMTADKKGKLQFQGVFADGLTTPGAILDYSLSDKGKDFAGQSFASYSYKYPNSSLFDSYFPKGTTKYRDKLSNWQTGIPFTAPTHNTVYTIDAESKKDGRSSGKKSSEKFVIYKVTQYDTLPKIAAYYGVPLAQIVYDNRVQDMLLLQNNTLFIRNPKKNANKPYNPPKLSDGTKQDIDSLLMGRGLHCEFGFEPINLNTGNFYLDRTDVTIPSLTSNFEITRTYNSKGADINSLFGRGWSFAFNEQVTSDEKENLYYTRTDGSILKFKKEGNKYLAPAGYDLTMTVKEKETKEADFGNGKEKYKVKEYQITDNDNQEKTFNYFGLLTSQKDEKGNVTKFDYNKNAQLTAITDPTGTMYNITMNEEGYISNITVPNGAKLAYEYDNEGHLIGFTDAIGVKTRYEYNKEGLMTAWYDGNGNKIIENTYDKEARVVKQVDGTGAVSTLVYSNGQTITTDGNGAVTTYHYDKQYRTTQISYPDDTSVVKAYDAENRLISETNELGQTSSYTYDKKGNQLTKTRFDGAVKKATYDDKNHITSEVDFDGTKTLYTYDKAGNLLSSQINQQGKMTFAVDKQGRITSTTDSEGNQTTYSYSGAFLDKIINPLEGVTSITYNAHGLPVSMTNPLGGITTMTYDGEGRKTSETTPDGQTTSYTYDGAGQVIAQTDGNGFTSTFTYDAVGNKLSMTNATGGSYTYAYDGMGNQIKMTNPEGQTTTYTYDQHQRLLSETNAAGQTLTYQRDALGRLLSDTNEAGKTTTYTYDDITNQIATMTDPLKQVTSNTYDDTGNLVKAEKPDGTQVSNEYNDLGWIIKRTDEAGIVTTYTYDENGNKLSETTNNRTTNYTYDSLGNVTKVTYPNQKTSTYTYDKMGNVLSFIDARGKETIYSYTKGGALATITDPLGNQTKIAYDGNGNQASVTDAAGYTTSTTYNGHNLPETVTDGLGNQTKYSYSQIEQITSATDALGNKKVYAYNGLGYPTAITDENGNVYKLSYTPTAQTEKVENPDGSTLTNTYDELDRLVKETHSNGLITEYEYDASNRVVHLKDNQGLDETYTYNASGERLTETNSLGEVTTYEYDEQNNVTKIVYADKTSETFTYDVMGNLLTSTDVEGKKSTYTYDENGNLTETTDAKGRSTAYTYDAINQIVTETNPAGGKMVYTYDILGNVSSITDEKGEKTSYGYDANQNLILYTDAKKNTTALKYDPLNRLTEKVSPTGAVQKYSYDHLGNLLTETSGEENRTSYTYDSMNRVTSITKPTGGISKYTYDQAGGLLSETDENSHKTTYENNLYGQAIKRTLPNGAKYSYAYDKLGRLSQQLAPKGLSQSYTYDVAGNLIKQEDQSKRVTTYDYDKAGRLLKTTNPADLTTTFTYDEAGNLAQTVSPSGIKTNYSYDVLDQLKTVSTPTGRKTSYEYDPVGQLTTRTINGQRKETYNYDPNGNLTETINALGQKSSKTYDTGDRLTSETNTAGQVTAYQYDQDDRLTKIISSEGAFNEFSYDGNNNLTKVTSGGQRVTSYSYDKADQLLEATTGTGAKAATTSYAYDSVGNITEMTNGNGKVTKYKYDELSNVVEKVNSLGDTTKYTYDADDRLESVKQANGKTISYDYNKLDQLLQVNYSEKADGTVMYTYDSEGRRISMNDLTGQTQYEYNDEDEITGVRQGDGSLIKYTYDDYGNIKKMTYADKSEVKYSYDELDRLTKVTDKENQTTTYEYDDAGNMTKIKRKDGTTSTLTYRLDNRVEEIVHRNKKGKELASYRYEYNADTFISEEVITQAGKTVVQTYEYDSLGQVVQMTVFDKKKKQELATYNYTYDQAGNKLTSTETIAGQEVKTEFTYDDNNRLLRMKNDQETITYEYDKNGNRLKQSGTDETLDYIYDTENRLLAVKDNQGLLLAALYDGENNRVFTASRTEKTTAYQLFKRQEKKSKVAAKHVPDDRRKSPATSPNGEENSLFWYGFTGNVLQALSSLPETVGDLWLEAFDTISRAYHQKIAKDRANEEGIVVNPPSLGKRPGEGKVTYSSEVNDVLIPYTTREDTYNYYEVRNYVNDVNQESTQVLQTYDDEKKTRETYTYGHERLSYTNHQTNEDYQYLTDARGSVTGLVQGEKITNTTHYSVFGRPTEKDDTGNPYGYTGEAQDITGYHYLRARYYDSHSSTFLTQDSYEGEEDNPLSQNGYTYVENNPINYTDPTGHKKNWFQNVWSGIKKTASKVVNKAKQVVSNVYNTAKKVVSTVWNGVKQVASSVWNGVKQVASSVYSGVTNFARTAYNTVSNYFSGGGTNYWQPASANYSGYSYYSGYPVASGAPSSQSTLSYAQIQAIQTAQRQQRLTADYQKATGSKGKPKTKEGQNLLRNWGKSLKNTLTKFCQTAKKVGKQVVEKAKSGVAFGAGVIKQSLSNNGIILPINSRLSRWLEQDWIKQNPAYNTGVFIGQLAGLAQAATEYVGAGLTFAAGTAGSGILDAFVGVASGGTAAAAIPAMAVAEMAAVTAATAAIGAHASKVLQNNFNSRNYSSSSSSKEIKTGDKTPGGHSFSEHGAERANERGFSKEVIDSIITNNKNNRKSKIDGFGRKTWEYVDKRGNKVVTNESGGIISVHSPKKGGYYIPK